MKMEWRQSDSYRDKWYLWDNPWARIHASVSTIDRDKIEVATPKGFRVIFVPPRLTFEERKALAEAHYAMLNGE